MSQTYSRSEDNVDLPEQEFAGLRRLRSEIEREGGNLADDQFARAQVLLAASDLLYLGTAVKVAGGAAMTLASMLMFNDETLPPPGFTRFELNHPDGTQAIVEVSFQPEGSLLSNAAVVATPSETETSSDSPVAEKRTWVTNENLDAQEVGLVLNQIAEATQEPPGSLPVIVGGGALAALVQALDAMNAATGNYRLQGLGSDEGVRWDVEIIATVQPSPKAVRRHSP